MTPNTQGDSWEREFDAKFNRSHGQMHHLGKRKERQECPTCLHEKESNPKGYYKTFLTEQKCYWNDEMYQDVKSFIQTIASKERAEGESKVVIFAFEKSGQCSSLHRAHPETDYEKGWNAAVEAMLRYLPQPTLAKYNAAVSTLPADSTEYDVCDEHGKQDCEPCFYTTQPTATLPADSTEEPTCTERVHDERKLNTSDSTDGECCEGCKKWRYSEEHVDYCAGNSCPCHSTTPDSTERV